MTGSVTAAAPTEIFASRRRCGPSKNGRTITAADVEENMGTTRKNE
jgi:hypothetical protein